MKTSASFTPTNLGIARGEKAQAFVWLESAWQPRHPVFATCFKLDPHLDPLRADPRQADLLRRTGWSQ